MPPTDNTNPTIETEAEELTLTEKLIRFYRYYYKEDTGTLAQRYPNEQRSLEISYGDLHQALPDVAEDWLSEPDQMREYAEEALRQYDLPADVSLSRAHVRLVELQDEHTYYPGGFSPTQIHEEQPYVGITGEIVASSDVDPRVTETAFECQRCGTMTYIPQTDSGFQEPHECQGCERQGPFHVNFDQSNFIDSQKLRLSEPPEVAGGEGQTIDVYVEDDLAGTVTAGDRVTINGRLCLEQRTSGNAKKSTFEPYLKGHSIEIHDSDRTSIEVTPEERQEINAIVDGEYGDPLEVAAGSIAPGVFGEQYDPHKRAIVLAVVGGEWAEGKDGSVERGSINVLLVGDPSTGKSALINQAQSNSPRSVGVSGKGAREAGITASAVRDDFSDGEWTLKAGAFVKANGGIVRIDELDDMPSDVRAAMLEPMANGKINVSKAGINAELQTRVGVIAAANPKYGRFDPFEPVVEQVDLGSTLISRFDLGFTVTETDDVETVYEVAHNIVGRREHKKRLDVAPGTVDPEETDKYDPPVESDLLRKWLALASEQPSPVIEQEGLQERIAEEFADFKTKHMDEDAPVPATWRDLEAQMRLAEAAAKLEFSETIEERHVRTALSLTMRSMRDFGMNEDGEFDADVRESGTSKPQRDNITTIEDIVQELCQESDENETTVEDVLDVAEDQGIDRAKAEKYIRKIKEEIGSMYEPSDGRLKWLGRA
ncbi:minichromosome maintenance protein MCM [Haloparvum sedimenti]|uniref:minichromosome maintenance protein MCM n=1 Tax=Haloparvum sedimenti TaxID=1678448 RepID=UPI00071E845C|nr:minichromosome maintenance protein MCM [Haloparvum sedimenti]